MLLAAEPDSDEAGELAVALPMHPAAVGQIEHLGAERPATTSTDRRVMRLWIAPTPGLDDFAESQALGNTPAIAGLELTERRAFLE